MSETEKVEFYNNNIKKILTSKENQSIDFIICLLENEDIKTSLLAWPDRLKIILVDRYFSNLYNIQ